MDGLCGMIWKERPGSFGESQILRCIFAFIFCCFVDLGCSDFCRHVALSTGVHLHAWVRNVHPWSCLYIVFFSGQTFAFLLPQWMLLSFYLQNNMKVVGERKCQICFTTNKTNPLVYSVSCACFPASLWLSLTLQCESVPSSDTNETVQTNESKPPAHQRFHLRFSLLDYTNLLFALMQVESVQLTRQV